ncbi:MAG: hypothetical protein CMH54_03725 [Myxococcales bacterium]|nr:hypothetical protein [Myxococcales bacterium]|tara:strand:+ start:834 stop:1880 length:1047 start_codon:yes stop_codon:yes gene_type:complete
MRVKPARFVFGLVGAEWLFIVIFASLLHVESVYYEPGPKGPEHRIMFPVERGESPTSVLRRLSRLGVVRDVAWVSFWARKQNATGCMKAGQHMLTLPASPEQALRALCESPPRPSVRFTIVEGMTLFEMILRMEKMGLGNWSELMVVEQPNTVETGPGGKLSPLHLEGYLYPDTYEVSTVGAVGELVQRARDRFEEVFDEVMASSITLERPLSRHSIVTLASIVEREAVVAEEMPLIAGVYLNRLMRSMKLQADPTLNYGPNVWHLRASPILRKDRSNLHNTYAHRGLPPGPIGAPSRQALQAVLNPAETKALFFVARGDGSGRHYFAKTYRQHKKNVRRYRKRTAAR